MNADDEQAAIRDNRRGRRSARRGAAAAAAVTLAAGMAAAPATAAIPDASTDAQQSTGPRAGVQLARMRTGPAGPPQPGTMRPAGPRNQAPVGHAVPPAQQHAVPPQQQQKWNGPLDPATQSQVDNAEAARIAAERHENTGQFEDVTQGVKQMLRERSALDPLGPVPAPVPTMPLPSNQEPPGYLNRYRDNPPKTVDEVLGPLGEELDRQMVRDRFDQSFIGMNLTEQERKSRLSAFNDLISEIHDARTPEDRKQGIADYDRAVGEFNKAELGERDNYDGHPRNEKGHRVRVVPNFVHEQRIEADRQFVEREAQREATKFEALSRRDSARSKAQHDPDFDGEPLSQPDSARSKAQGDPSFDGEPLSQPDSARSKAQGDPSFDGEPISQPDSARSKAQHDANFDGDTGFAPGDGDDNGSTTETNSTDLGRPPNSDPDSARSKAQGDPGFDGDPVSQPDSARSRAQGDPGFDGDTDTDAGSTPSSPSTGGDEGNANAGESDAGGDSGGDGHGGFGGGGFGGGGIGGGVGGGDGGSDGGGDGGGDGGAGGGGGDGGGGSGGD